MNIDTQSFFTSWQTSLITIICLLSNIIYLIIAIIICNKALKENNRENFSIAFGYGLFFCTPVPWIIAGFIIPCLIIAIPFIIGNYTFKLLQKLIT